LGYRYLHPRWQLDVSYFTAQLDDMVSVFAKDPNQPTLRQYNNLYSFRVWGWTSDVVVKLSPEWTLNASYMYVRYTGGVEEDYKPARDRVVVRLAYWRERGLSGQLTFNYPAVGQGFTNAYGWNTYLNLVYRMDAAQPLEPAHRQPVQCAHGDGALGAWRAAQRVVHLSARLVRACFGLERSSWCWESRARCSMGRAWMWRFSRAGKAASMRKPCNASTPHWSSRATACRR
jgi:hypothetical protein